MQLKSDVFQLVYTSVSAFEFSESDLQDILSVANDRNMAYGVTGLLGHMAATGEIIQLLEGSESYVRMIFASIARDPRHVAISIRYEGTADERLFKRWRMCFAGNEAWHALDPYRLDAPGRKALEPAETASPPMRILREYISTFL